MYNSEKKNIVKIEENHYEELIVFLKESDRKNRDLDFWRTRINLWWDNNPFFSEKKCRGFIIISNNKITGFFGLIPFNFTFRNTQQTCYAHTSWNVSKDSRFLSLDLFNKVILNHKINLHFNGTPNENVKKILEFNNFENTRSKSNAYIYFNNFIDFYEIIKNKKINIIIKIILLCIGFIQYLTSNFFLLFVSSNIEVLSKNIQKAKLEFNNKFKKSNREKIILWFYKSKKINDKIIFYSKDKDNIINGSIIFKIENKKKYTCVDIWPLDNKAIVKSLIRKSIKKLSEDQCIVFFENYKKFIGNNLLKIGIFINFFKARPLYFYNNNDLSRIDIKQEKNIDLSLLYSDYNL